VSTILKEENLKRRKEEKKKKAELWSRKGQSSLGCCWDGLGRIMQRSLGEECSSTLAIFYLCFYSA